MFCAVDLGARVRANLTSHINRLREMAPHVQASWSREENIHLTLKFLGEIQTSRINNLSSAAARAVANLKPFRITIGETGVFPQHGPQRVLWIGVKDESGKLAELHTRLEEACALEGFAREERPFRPHLTIARLRKPHGARALAAAHKEMHFQATDAMVADLSVIRSELDSAGSRYTVISRHLLER